MNTRTKILMVVTLSFMALMFNDLLILFILSIFSLLLYLVGRRHSIRNAHSNIRSLLILILSLLFIQILFRPSGELLWHWGPIRISREGIQYGTSASLRLLIIFLSAGYLWSISYYEYLIAFQSWKMPYELSFLMASVLQFLPLLRKEFKQMNEALMLRGINLSKLPLLKRITAFRELILPILGKAISSLKYRVISLEMRGFRLSRNRTSLHEDQLKVIDWVVQNCLLAAIILAGYIRLTY